MSNLPLLYQWWNAVIGGGLFLIGLALALAGGSRLSTVALVVFWLVIFAAVGVFFTSVLSAVGLAP